MQNDSLGNSKDTFNSLSIASELLIKACDNYLSINYSNSKAADVLNIKASVFYNNRLFEEARKVYSQIINDFEGTGLFYDAIRMTAQAFYEEKKFDEAQEWYRKLSNVAKSGDDKIQAVNKIAESIFRMAESYEEQGRLKEASEQYERVALEFPESKIAEVALFNGGLVREKMAEWSSAIIAFQKIIQKYPNSNLLAKTNFRIAKNYEKMLQWDFAAEAYLNVTLKFPSSELAPVSLYNAGFCFENAGKLKESAATFEKMAYLYIDSPDAPDVLFKAGEIYGLLKDWESVSRVNQTFARKFGNDADRIIQALCMNGIALYMQNNESEAIVQLEKAIVTFSKIKDPSTVNMFYTARAVFTIGEIYHSQMDRVALSSQGNNYKKQLTQKSELLNKALSSYTRVIKFNLSEWTTRAISQIGQLYEDFALGIFKQQRNPSSTFEQQLALELGIAQAVEQMFIDKALYYHEQNVKLGIKENINDKYVQLSKKKLTYLPYIAAENYLSLVEITKKTTASQSLEGFASIAKTLQTLQKIAPFQEKAIELHLKCLELGSTYQQIDDFYNKAASSITKTSFYVGETYSNVVTIARNAPIPEKFNPYERFVYRTKLLKQIEGYEDQAVTNFLKTIKIAEAYKINDQSVTDSKTRIAQLLFNKGRCYDILSIIAFSSPPYPDITDHAQMQEYKEQFDEIGSKFKNQAMEIYKSILNLSSQNYVLGEYVTHSYVRLFQIFPEDFGVSSDVKVESMFSTDSTWRCSIDSLALWTDIDFPDSAWHSVNWIKPLKIGKNYPDSNALLMWYLDKNSDSLKTVNKRLFFRKIINFPELPQQVSFQMYSRGKYSFYLNGVFTAPDSIANKGSDKSRYDLLGKFRKGYNTLAIEATTFNDSTFGICPFLSVISARSMKLPKPPGAASFISLEDVRDGVYVFPEIFNFSLTEGKNK